MIVAAYTSGNALWATVVPVTAIVRFTRNKGQQQDRRKAPEKKTAFATALLSARCELELTEGQEFNARA